MLLFVIGPLEPGADNYTISSFRGVSETLRAPRLVILEGVSETLHGLVARRRRLFGYIGGDRFLLRLPTDRRDGRQWVGIAADPHRVVADERAGGVEQSAPLRPGVGHARSRSRVNVP